MGRYGEKLMTNYWEVVPTEPQSKVDYLNLTRYEKKIYKYSWINHNYYVFIAGVLTALSVNLLTTFLTQKLNGKFSFYLILSFITSVFSTVLLSKYTIICIDIQNSAFFPGQKPRINIFFEEFFNRLSQLRVIVIGFFVSLVITLGFLTMCFHYINNIHFLTYNDGRLKYEGGWSENQEMGYGESYYENGALRYKGSWQKGMKNGIGEEFYRNGELKYRGEWDDGQWDGQGIFYSDEGKQIYQGIWDKGLVKELNLNPRTTFNGCQKVKIVGIKDAEILITDSGQKIKLIGIKDFSKNEQALHKILINKVVYLENDSLDGDNRGNLLRYVYLSDGTLVNEYLIRKGYCEISGSYPNIKYINILLKANMKEHL